MRSTYPEACCRYHVASKTRDARRGADFPDTILSCIARDQLALLFSLKHRVRLLLGHGIRPYLVFDGGCLPAKAGKEEERRTRRAANMERAKQLVREGNASGAHQFFAKAADVTPLMAHQLIQVFPPPPPPRAVLLLFVDVSRESPRSREMDGGQGDSAPRVHDDSTPPWWLDAKVSHLVSRPSPDDEKTGSAWEQNR